MNGPRSLERRPIFRGKVVDLAVERVRLPDGRVAELEIVRHPGAAAVVPLTAGGEVLLLRQYRHATGDWVLEVPAGKLEAGEDPAVGAARELEEETGARAPRLEALGWIWTTPGFTDERIWLYLAPDVVEDGRQALQTDELLWVERLPFAVAVERAAAGDLQDAKSICALLRADAHLRRLAARGETPDGLARGACGSDLRREKEA